MARLAVIPGGRAGAPSGPLPAAEGRGAGLLEELYRRHAAAVLARCRYLLREDEAARDAAQDVFVRALRSAGELRTAASPTAFLLRMATNHCLNLLRADRAAWKEEVSRMARERTAHVQPDSRELVRALLGAAGVEEQEVAVLYFVDELTQAEIAEATGRSLPTVRKRLRDFLAAARGALREAFPDLSLPDPEELP
ncbi:MAG TPA: sigma-70 family RNA polymerase sigma factor [Anaeromyxobacteraceae bacterium]|nr:sigma-70 family RNA polymerase sigma factor [Anaeromyxobacteraceae bacterium]